MIHVLGDINEGGTKMANKNYNKISSKPAEENATAQDAEPKTSPEKKQTKPKPKYGYVANCEKLNIRNKSSLDDSEILVIVDKGTKVEINEDLSTDKFYSVKVYCPNDITVIGYAMKDFITIK